MFSRAPLRPQAHAHTGGSSEGKAAGTGKGECIRDTLDSAFTLAGLSLTPAWTSVNSQALIHAAKASLGITVLPDILVKEEIKKGELIPLETGELSLQHVNHIVYHKDKYIPEAMQLFLETAMTASHS